jgi:hypothetical protein
MTTDAMNLMSKTKGNRHGSSDIEKAFADFGDAHEFIRLNSEQLLRHRSFSR